jgi:glutathione peroxidase
MMHTFAFVALAASALAIAFLGSGALDDAPVSPPVEKESPLPPVLRFTVAGIDGEKVELGKYHGKVLLIVNVASRCGYTPQYRALQALHEQYEEQGLAVLGFPANEFGNQEPGTNEEIAAFCEASYGVKFDMFAKVVVKGEEICPLYKLLTSEEHNPDHAGEVKWNFEKFLVSRDGRIVNRFRSRIAPDSEEVIAAIEAELARPSPPPIK